MNFKECRGGKCQKFGLNSFKENWFTENGTLNEDFAWSIEIKRVIHRQKSLYQDILVFDSSKFGRCLALDAGIRCTERDEYAYHEMIAFLPLLSHPDAKKVLVIGGGDGGVVREVIKLPSVQSVVLCEIDEEVMKVCDKYMPFMTEGFRSPKVTVKTEDGMEYVRNQKGQFDVIINDSQKTVGLSDETFEKPRLEALKTALRPGGILASKGDCYWFDLHRKRQFLDTCRSVFEGVDYASTFVPSLPGGHCSILLCAVSPETNFRKPLQRWTTQTLKEFGLRYYTPDVHCAAFALPPAIAKELELKEEIFLK